MFPDYYVPARLSPSGCGFLTPHRWACARGAVLLATFSTRSEARDCARRQGGRVSIIDLAS